MSSVETRPLSFVKGFHEIRPINPPYLERLRAKVREIGVKPYPLSVTPDGLLFAGRHRYEAFKAEGISDCLMHISQPTSLDREAIELNRASEDALPMTFVDYAEFVWRRLGDGLTQQALANEIGWTRGRVSQFAMLQEICEEVWKIVATMVANAATAPGDGSDTEPQGAVAISERILRDIVSLTPEQQVDLIRKLSRGKNGKGHPFTKKDFKEEAERFRAYNALLETASEALSERIQGERLDENQAAIAEALKERAYIDEYLEGGKPGKKFSALVQSYIDAFEEAMNVRVLLKDMRELTTLDIPDNSVDAIITDPPYPREYIELFDSLGALAGRVLKHGGSLLCLCGQSYLPQYIELLSRHLDYQWMLAVHMPGGQAVQLHQKDITAFWKPILWFTKGPRDGKWVSDFIRTDVNNNDKAYHHWGQSEQIVHGMIERISLPGEIVLDPFLGGGTTGVVCRKLKRKFIGVEIDEAVAKVAQRRIGGE